ncbi:hypothetical protein L1887_07498 [Cichorium endivia]|nr:hypothetical protein L1887_07498 [Cichorium endivia]
MVYDLPSHVQAEGSTTAGGHRHRATRAHRHRGTPTLLLRATLDRGPTAANTLLPQSESNTLGVRQFHHERKDTAGKGHTRNLRQDRIPRLTTGSQGAVVEVRPLTGHRRRTTGHGARAVSDRRGPPREPSRSRSRSPAARGYSRGEADVDVSPSPYKSQSLTSFVKQLYGCLFSY